MVENWSKTKHAGFILLESIKTFLRIAEFVSHEALSSMARSALMSWLVVATIAVSLSILGGFWLIVQDLHRVSYQVGGKVPIAVFLSDDADPRGIETAIKEFPEVESLKLITKDQAWKDMQQDMRSRMTFDSLLDANPLPNSFTVQSKSPDLTPVLAERIAKMPGIEDIQYGAELLKKLSEFSAFIRAAGLGIGAILALASLAVIMNTIRLTVMARRREIEIMHLVGASNSFIAWPFLLEGILFGLFGAILTSVVLIAWRSFTLTKWQELFPFIPMSLEPFALAETLAVLTVLGIALGAVGSLLSVRRHIQLAANDN
ncbi:MAG: permease-like cell division protein FtsX [Candidatus Sericytochromatia bacterium]|nr:permease-like cell division protein FtsX [Candidatus Sericytochromatia bacterium]